MHDKVTNKGNKLSLFLLSLFDRIIKTIKIKFEHIAENYFLLAFQTIFLLIGMENLNASPRSLLH